MSSTRIAARLQQTAVKPLLSSNRNDARFRVMRLYKAWFRQAAFVGKSCVIQCCKCFMLHSMSVVNHSMYVNELASHTFFSPSSSLSLLLLSGVVRKFFIPQL